MTSENSLIRRESIAEIVAHRDAALQKYEQAYDLLVEAGRAVGRAGPTGYFNHPEAWRGHKYIDLPGREDWTSSYRKAVDRCVWSHLIKAGQFETLMDATAREQFRTQIEKDPPEVTVDTCYATMHQLMLDSGTIFKRGIAVAFSKLDRRFRSHDGFKIGSRIILRVHDGGMSRFGDDVERLRDIERVFCTLDGRSLPEYSALPRDDAPDGKKPAAPICTLIRNCYSYSQPAGGCEDDFFRVKVFKNGNAHLYFKRDDLVKQVNMLLAAYYGANLGDASEETRNAYRPGQNVTLAKNLGWFPTPAPVAERVIEEARLYRSKDLPPLRILEPSAGEGALVTAARLARSDVAPSIDAVEIHPGRARLLRTKCKAVAVADFLTTNPDAGEPYDRIIMNPPFDRGQDIDHVLHALKWLKPGGLLVSVMSASAEYAESKKALALRAEMERRKGYFVDLPEQSFAESGTNINTVICVIGRERR